MTSFQNTLSFAKTLDEEDKLRAYRHQFYFPLSANGKPQLYFCGNSLGLQPIRTRDEVLDILENWKSLAVEGHFHGDDPWVSYNEKLIPAIGEIVGAQTEELAIMNTLTVNIHLLLVSFYRPTASRYKIVIERDAFPSDRHAIESQLRWHGLDPEKALIILKPREGEVLLREEDIQNTLSKNREEIATILLGGVNYYTGQVLNIEKITSWGHSIGAYVGFDLAHAAGNIFIQLHDWNVDFAAWCNYKYLNSGPGSIATIFIHSKHHGSSDIPRFEGWWGNRKETRFLMDDKFDPAAGAEAWVMSTPPTLAIAPLRASLELFEEVGMTELLKKSKKLTAYLRFLIEELEDNCITIITPKKDGEYGCQLSIQVKNVGKSLFDSLTDEGIIVDWREPGVIRVAPVPFYNSFEDIYSLVQILEKHLNN